MEDFSLPESRRRYYEKNKAELDSHLEKMWRIFWEEQLDDSDYAKEIASDYTQKSLEKVWLNNEKKFLPDKMPKIDSLFQFPKAISWWFGEIVGRENITKEIQRIKDKKGELEWRNLATQTLLDKLNPIFDNITKAVLKLKDCSNRKILAAWFQEDDRKPILGEIESCLKISVVRGYRSIRWETALLSETRASKWTLLRINAYFRFYYIWKETALRPILFDGQMQKEVVERAYIAPCPEEALQVKDNVVAKGVGLMPSQIKELRNQGVWCVLSIVREDSQMEKPKELEVQDKLVDHLASNRVWNAKDRTQNYSSRNIGEALNIREEILLKLEETIHERSI